ncbi:MAG: hypothetical protein IKK46_03655 [Clostridia bacterium]|nr:hypothetical protein [Clostridia bacterium]MBR3809377.1 hypothetical protein [Clostridia bacterium]
MKTRKILALVMAIALLAVSMSVVASAAGSVSAAPTKITYTDIECFDPTGLVIKDGTGATVSYETDYQYFTFSVELDEKLTIYMTEIEVFYKGESAGFVQITVDHAGGEITPVNNHSHGQICEGCGVICKNADHDVPYWVPNDDAGLLTSETETGTCSICGDTVSRYISGTATYPNVFATSEILVLLLSFVSMIVEAFALI